MINDEPETIRATIEEYLRSNFQKPALGVLARLLREPPDYSYRIRSIEPHCAHGEFPGFGLYWAGVDDSYLEFTRLPGVASWGLFAVGEGQCLPLGKSMPENLSMVLSRATDLDTVNSARLAVLLCDAALADRMTRLQVIVSAADLERAGVLFAEGDAEYFDAQIKPRSWCASRTAGR